MDGMTFHTEELSMLLAGFHLLIIRIHLHSHTLSFLVHSQVVIGSTQSQIRSWRLFELWTQKESVILSVYALRGYTVESATLSIQVPIVSIVLKLFIKGYGRVTLTSLNLTGSLSDMNLLNTSSIELSKWMLTLTSLSSLFHIRIHDQCIKDEKLQSEWCIDSFRYLHECYSKNNRK